MRATDARALAAGAALFLAAAGPLPAAPPDSSPTLAPATHLPESRTPSPAPVATPPSPALSAPVRLSVRGQVLSLGGGYLVFTTGQALRLGSSLAVPAHAPIGIFVRATLDTASRRIVALAFQPKVAMPDEIDAARVPLVYLASSVASLPSIPPATGSVAGPLSRQATITIRVNVPNNTPQLDDVYVATDRSQFGAAEVRMQRLDLHRWVVQISLVAGTTLRYEFTRGFNTTIERDRSGGIATPRAATVTDGLVTDDTVQRWSDIQ